MIDKTVIEYIQHVAQKLKPLCLPDAVCIRYAWWIIEKITNQSTIQLLAQKSLVLHENQEQLLSELITKLVVENMPLHYLIGSLPFAGLQITVRPPILIPRPETEEWVLHLIDQIRATKQTTFTLFDIATGSGCIGLAVAKAFPHAHIIATDIAPYALELAEENAKNNTISNISFITSDLFSNLGDHKADIIVSNPPYISVHEWRSLEDSVKKWEDYHALVAQQEGYAFIKNIAQQAPQFLTNNPLLQELKIPRVWIEIGHQQGDHARELFAQFGYKKIVLLHDFCGKDRVIIGSRA